MNLLTQGKHDESTVEIPEEAGLTGPRNGDKEKAFESLDLFLCSDEKWEDTEDNNFRVGKYTVKHYFNPKTKNLSDGILVPKDVETDQFKPTAVSLDNILVFVALGSGDANHKGGNRSCGLHPTCNIKWQNGASISKVRVLEGPTAIVGSDVWACTHHNQASIDKVSLQTQVLCKPPIEK